MFNIIYSINITCLKFYMFSILHLISKIRKIIYWNIIILINILEY